MRTKNKPLQEVEAYGLSYQRAVIALETIARRLGTIEECLLTIVDSNDRSLRMKDIKRAEVYSTHLGDKLKTKGPKK